MKCLYRGFTLLQLIIVVAILSILAWVAWEGFVLPSYNDYLLRANISEIVLQASGFKSSIAEKAAKDGTLASAGKGLTVSTGGRVPGGSVTNAGVVTVAATNATFGTAVSIVLVPSLGAGGRIAWQCSTNGDSTQWRYVPAECRH